MNTSAWALLAARTARQAAVLLLLGAFGWLPHGDQSFPGVLRYRGRVTPQLLLLHQPR